MVVGDCLVACQVELEAIGFACLTFVRRPLGSGKAAIAALPFPCARLSLVCKQLTRSDTFRLQGSLTGRWERLMIFALAILRIDFEVFDLIRPHGFLPLQRELYFPGFPSLFMLL